MNEYFFRRNFLWLPPKKGTGKLPLVCGNVERVIPIYAGGFIPFCNLLILAIALYSYTGDILYYLCANVTYKTFTHAICSPHERFAKVYFYTPVEGVPGPHKKWVLNLNVLPDH